jgi:hypothetical protein
MNISQLVQSLLEVARSGAGPKLLVLITEFTNSIAANPTQLNVVAQVAQFEVGALAILPGLAQSELAALASIINAEATKLLTPVAVATK